MSSREDEILTGAISDGQWANQVPDSDLPIADRPCLSAGAYSHIYFVINLFEKAFKERIAQLTGDNFGNLLH